MLIDYHNTRNALTLIARHCNKVAQEFMREFVNDASEKVEELEGVLKELEEEARDLRVLAGCEMCVDDGVALYGAVGKYYYGDDVTADCFCVRDRQERERQEREHDIFPLTREWVIRIDECIGELKETGFVRATFTDYMKDRNNEERHKIMFHRIFTHLNEFNKEGLVIAKEGNPYAMAWRKGEELVIGTMV